MFRLGCSKIPSFRLAGGVSPSLRRPCHLLSSLKPSFARNLIITTSSRLSSRRLSNVLDPMESEIFNYTAGRFLQVFDILSRLYLFRTNVTYSASTTPFAWRVFDIPGLFSIIAKTLHCKREEIVGFEKLAEGSFYRVFLVTLATGFQLVARIPYPRFFPKGAAHSRGLCVFLYVEERGYARDLKELSGNEGIPLDEQTIISLDRGPFCIGPEMAKSMWCGRREQLDVFRGPYEDVESVLIAGAEKELAYLDRFGSPRLPERRIRREVYDYKKRPPSDHANNLRRYLHLAPWLVPDDDSLNAFCIRHPDLTDSDIRISTDSSGLQVVSLLDWHHASVQPLFLLAGTPYFFHNPEEPFPQSEAEPTVPDNFDSLSEEEQVLEPGCLGHRFLNYHYIRGTETYNKTHYEAIFYPLNNLRRTIIKHSGFEWEGETIELLHELMNLVLHEWENFATDGTPSPVVFRDDEVVAAAELHQKIMESDRTEKMVMDSFGCLEAETWVPPDHYEKAKAYAQEMRRMTLKACREDEEVSEEEAALAEANWLFDDVDEQELEEYK